MTGHVSLGAPLTRRETQILQMVAGGASNAAIGERLFVAEETVKTHLRRIFRKLGVGNRTSATTVALHRGLISTSGTVQVSPVELANLRTVAALADVETLALLWDCARAVLELKHGTAMTAAMRAKARVSAARGRVVAA